MKKVYFDCEFTGLHKNTNLISIGFVCGDKALYAEFNDYDNGQISPWLKDNVLSCIGNKEDFEKIDKIFSYSTTVYTGGVSGFKSVLAQWIGSLGQVEIWSDCLAYDWVLFCDIFGDAFNIPGNIYYIPFDLCTLLKVNNIDPDINREEFSNVKDIGLKHNALWDAYIIKKCCEKIFESA